MVREVVHAGAELLDARGEFFETADIFSVPFTYDEPKGISVLEAMSHGVPVIEPRRGALTEMVERTGGGLLVEPDDPDALGAAILSLYKDRELAAGLGQRGAEGVREHYSTARMAERALAADDSRDRHDVIRVGRVTHAEQEAGHERGEEAEQGRAGEQEGAKRGQEGGI